MKRALITGVSGQDGSYLAEFLLTKGYAVTGVIYDATHTENIKTLAQKIDLVEGDVTEREFVQSIVTKQFDEIYNLASISTVQSPWEDPASTVVSCGVVPLVFLEAIRTTSPHTKFFQASSAEMYGDPGESPQTELTPFKPRSPYGYGKLLAHQAVECYREQYNVFAVSGILFNHESPRRGQHFVTRKITSTLARIANGSQEVLRLGNIESKRDWSFAGDITRGMWLSLQHDVPQTYVFASGETHTVREFVEVAAAALGITITWQGSGVEEKGLSDNKIIVEIDPAFYRPLESEVRRGSIAKITHELGWLPETSFKELVGMMISADSHIAKP